MGLGEELLKIAWDPRFRGKSEAWKRAFTKPPDDPRSLERTLSIIMEEKKRKGLLPFLDLPMPEESPKPEPPVKKPKRARSLYIQKKLFE